MRVLSTYYYYRGTPSCWSRLGRAHLLAVWPCGGVRWRAARACTHTLCAAAAPDPRAISRHPGVLIKSLTGPFSTRMLLVEKLKGQLTLETQNKLR